MSSHAGEASPEVHAQLAKIVSMVTATPTDLVSLEAAFVDDLRIDSLSMVEILEGASRHFGVRIEDEAAKDFVHVHDLVSYICDRLGRVSSRRR